MKTLVGLTILALLCWVIMFLAGTDVWYFLGKPDFWRLSSPPNSDIRAFAYAFYVQFFMLIGMLIGNICVLVRVKRSGKESI